MDDELEDKIFYQTYISHMKLLSKFAVGVPPLNSSLSYVWRIFRFYLIRPEVLFCAIILFLFLLYLQAVELWSRGLVGRLTSSLGYNRRTNQMQVMTSSSAEKHSWELTKELSAVYAVQGRRPKMEDRFVIDENINNTGIAFFAIFDGHGGEFAADYAKDYLVQNLYNKIIETSNVLKGTHVESSNLRKGGTDVASDCGGGVAGDENKENQKNVENKGGTTTSSGTTLIQRKSSFRKSYSTAEDCPAGNCNREQDVFLNKLNSIVRTKDSFLSTGANNNNYVKPQTYEGRCYIENGKINFGKMLTDEVLAADFKLVEIAKKATNLAGTTALIAIMEGTRLIVANVGDSRGVMCDVKGNAIPLSFDHKPQQVRERKRIQEAGGFIAFKGVWRVAGILATSRAMGDYPLKDKKLVIADPDILSFDLVDHRPLFLILASDGLWDTFSNEEAVAFIKDRLHEPHFGAKSLTLQSYYRGSVDNITVLVIVFRDGKWVIGSSKA